MPEKVATTRTEDGQKQTAKTGTEIQTRRKTEFLRHLLGIIKLDKEKNQCIRGKTGAQNIVKEIK